MMNIIFKKISGFDRGTLLSLLTDAYSFDRRYEAHCAADWQAFDSFFFDDLPLADKYGFITTLGGEAIGFVSWDPRNMPDYAIIGHNCIATRHKGNGYGRMQLQEAVNRITRYDTGRIIVCTNDDLIPAQRMYESVGFKLRQRRKNQDAADFVHEFLDYEYPCQ